MVDLLLVMALGFLGSFGHCIGMCGPLTVAFSLSQQQSPTWRRTLWFHGLLNLGRIASYLLIGASIGALGSVLIAGGQLAGIESGWRRGLALFTGGLLVWMGLAQINPTWFAKLPLFHAGFAGKFHQQLSVVMLRLAESAQSWTPLLLGLTWGLIPCGFLYTAQLKAAETGSLAQGALTMLAFGVGTLPAMLGIGVSASRLSADRRSQLFRLGGYVTLLIGLLTLWRTGEMADYTGHVAIGLLMIALIARPISRLWAAPLRYRRALGVSAFLFAVAHTLHTLQHTLSWNLDAIAFMLPEQQQALGAGAIALGLMVPAALTSCDRLVQALGKAWRYLHLLTIPALLCGTGHTLWLGSHYFGALEIAWPQQTAAGGLISLTLLVLLVRQRWFWSLLSLEKFYAPVLKSTAHARESTGCGMADDTRSGP
jgi:uncharacterized protein